VTSVVRNRMEAEGCYAQCRARAPSNIHLTMRGNSTAEGM
jgi:hypothetical protein